MNKPIKFATTQPNVFYKGGHGGGGCTVESESDLLIGAHKQTQNAESVWERPYKTIPFIGRGPSRPMLESNYSRVNF